MILCWSMPDLGLIGWYDVELKCVEIWIVSCWVRCKCFKDGDNSPMCIIMIDYVNILTSLAWIVMKGKFLCDFYWVMMMMII